jgi:hypothetical protein
MRPEHVSTAAELLEGASRVMRRYVVLPGEAELTALALYVLHTWAIKAAYATPYLVVISPERRSGKTRLLEVLRLLVREPWHTVSASEAAMFRKIEKHQPTLLLDEVEAVFGSYSERTEPLRALLDAGNRRGAVATRCVGNGKEELRDFSTFCCKVLAGIDSGKLPDTILDRAIVLRMRRRRTGVPLERLRFRAAEPATEELRNKMAEWAEANLHSLEDSKPWLPDELGDRALDGWEPLLAIAELAGGGWLMKAREAALKLSAEDEATEMGYGPLVLRAMRDALGEASAISTARLLGALNEDDELPFGGWNEGKGIAARDVARLLRPYGIRSCTVRVDGKTLKGHARKDVVEAFECWIPDKSDTSDTNDTSAAAKPRQQADVSDVSEVSEVSGVSAPLWGASEEEDDVGRAERLALRFGGEDER